MKNQELAYLELLSDQYPTRDAACTEIINLSAILNLPKGTEHFVSDIHGEHEAFDHVMKNASGVIWEYIEEVYGSRIREQEKRQLALIICYPNKIMEKAKQEEPDMDDFYRITLLRLVRICKRASSKYTRSKVRKSLPAGFAYILEELIHEDADRLHKNEYYNQIIDTIISLGRAEEVIQALTRLILRLAVDRLHVIGDIFDRGPAAELILDDLIVYHSVDIQWGNHDINWMGAASGADACICNVVRICAKYNNLHTLEEGYGINLVPLATFAMECYKDDPCGRFIPSDKDNLTEKESELIAKMHKAITVLQFKAEAAVIKRNPTFYMDDRNLLHKIDFRNGTVELEGKAYPMLDCRFPTINPEDPYQFSPEEIDVLEKIRLSFINCQKLQEHVRFLFNKGSMYKIHNGNLLYHGCIPMTPEGELKEVEYEGRRLKGKELFDAIDKTARQGFFLSAGDRLKQRGQDVMWYLWCGADSPLFGKDRMATFERYFVEDQTTHHEEKDPYYEHRNTKEVCVKILENFGLTGDRARIINGHVPVEIKSGESPIKAEGKLIDIDGGFAKAYQKVTGMAGYTLIYNSKGLALTQHEPFTSVAQVVEGAGRVTSTAKYIEYIEKRIKVSNTDNGKDIKKRIKNLKKLLKAYEEGLIKEKG